MTCPACGARTPPGAEWCSLCYAPLRTEPPVAEPADVAAEPTTSDEPADRTDAAEVSGPGDASEGVAAPVVTGGGRFRRTGEGLDWRCAACETWNPIERRTCTLCGTSFTHTLAPADDDGPTDADELTVVGASLLLPGVGHVLLGRTGPGTLRMILYVTWLAGGILLLRAASGSGQPILPAVPLLLGAVLVLVASVVEVQRTVTGNDTTILRPRVTLWLVVVVLGALMLSFFGATLAVGR